jgi:two-component system chemotaxis response regulator CheB
MKQRRRRIRVLIVDDSAFVRQALSRMLSNEPDIEIVGQAVDGKDALEKALLLRPDVVTLDVQMPRMGGLEALEHLMGEAPVPVLLLSSQTREGADVTIRGLELGALEFVDKSRVQGNMNLLNLAEELKQKIRAIAHVHVTRRTRAAAPVPAAALPLTRAAQSR